MESEGPGLRAGDEARPRGEGRPVEPPGCRLQWPPSIASPSHRPFTPRKVCLASERLPDAVPRPPPAGSAEPAGSDAPLEARGRRGGLADSSQLPGPRPVTRTSGRTERRRRPRASPTRARPRFIQTHGSQTFGSRDRITLVDALEDANELAPCGLFVRICHVRILSGRRRRHGCLPVAPENVLEPSRGGNSFLVRL